MIKRSHFLCDMNAAQGSKHMDSIVHCQEAPVAGGGHLRIASVRALNDCVLHNVRRNWLLHSRSGQAAGGIGSSSDSCCQGMFCYEGNQPVSTGVRAPGQILHYWLHSQGVKCCFTKMSNLKNIA